MKRSRKGGWVICNCLSELGWGADGDGGLSKGLIVVIKLRARVCWGLC